MSDEKVEEGIVLTSRVLLSLSSLWPSMRQPGSEGSAWTEVVTWPHLHCLPVGLLSP